MAFSLVLNSSNVVGSTNSQFSYKFLTGNFVAKNMEMCLSSTAIPYSFFNVSSYYNNNKFQLSFPTGITNYPLTITLPDGFYQISDINNFVQNQCILNGMYLINAIGQNVFFFQMVVSTTYYAIQTLYFQVPAASQYVALGYTLPPLTTGANLWCTSAGLPSVINQVPRMLLGTTGSPAVMMGYVGGLYPTSATQTSTVSILGTLCPIGSTVNSIIARVSCLKNSITMPSDILDSFPVNGSFGGAIIYDPSFEKWVDMSDGTYSNITLSLVDQNFGTIYANDPNVCITLIIRRRNH